MRQWVRHTFEILQKLAIDQIELEAEFGVDLQGVTFLESLLSDPHSFGRSVARLEFRSGAKILFKPHSLEIEKAWEYLLGWINERSSLPKILASRSVSAHSHGWSLNCESRPCATSSEQEGYWARIGALLALGYIFGITDITRDNLIDHGEFPVMVDCETVLSPTIEVPVSFSSDPLKVRYQQVYEDSVVRTSLLPRVRGRLSRNISQESVGPQEDPHFIPLTMRALALRQPCHVEPKT